MPSLLDRETFTLLNLSESGSESIPDLDLVQPAKKQTKRKVKHKRRPRNYRPSHNAEPTADLGPLSSCECCSSRSWSRVGGAVIILGCLGSLVYITFTLTTRIRMLESKLSSVDDASKSFPASIMKLKSSLENLQANESAIYSRFIELEEKIAELESSVSKLSNQPLRGQEIQQNLADFGGKLTEVKQTADVLRNKTKLNSHNIDKITDELNSLKLDVLETRKNQSPGEVDLTSFKSLLTDTRRILDEEKGALSSVNSTLAMVAQNSSARMDLFYKDLNNVQGKISQMEDDNKNISSRLVSLDKTMNAALTDVKVNLSSLSSTLSQTKQSSSDSVDVSSEIAKAPRKGPRDKKSTNSD